MKNKLNTSFLLQSMCALSFLVILYCYNLWCFFWQRNSVWSTQSNTHEYISIFRWGFDWESNPGHLILVVILYGNWLLCSGENMSSTGQRERISEKKTKWRLDLVLSVSRTRVNLIYLVPQRQKKKSDVFSSYSVHILKNGMTCWTYTDIVVNVYVTIFIWFHFFKINDLKVKVQTAFC